MLIMIHKKMYTYEQNIDEDMGNSSSHIKT